MPAAAEARFTSGVQAGDVRSTSAILWARPARGGKVRLVVARDRSFRRGRRVYALGSRKSNDYTLRRTVRGLDPDRRYWFQFREPGRSRSRIGTFTTAPTRRADQVIEFAFTGDTSLGFSPTQGGVFRRMRRERNDFNVHLGDTIYPPKEAVGALEPLWAAYKRNLDNRRLSALRRDVSLYSHWDDHEFADNFSRKQKFVSNGVTVDGELVFRQGRRAFLDYAPVSYSPTRGLYRRFRWGKNLELFFLDERSFRDAHADQGGACINPETGRRDLAPTAPQWLRDRLATGLPATGLTRPVSQACLDRMRDPNRDLLGDSQFDRFTRAIDRSTARWKLVMNEVPIQQYYVLFPYERWEGFAAERQRLLRFLQLHVRNVIFLSTDAHATLAGDARLQTLEPGGPVNTGILEVTVGPAATTRFSTLFDRMARSAGGGAFIDRALLTPPPPQGVGMRCSVIDAFSYGQVRVTNNRLKVTPKGVGGRPLPGCAPIVLNRR